MAKNNAKKKSCFIIMPITTPKSMVADYNDDKDHFKHVMNCLFVPAVEKAGFEPIKPIARGEENIQAKIIKKLETSELVLCDMSTLNANVFFELGIRTSLNRPVCLVKDNLTEKTPFDTTTIYRHEYKAGLRQWEEAAEKNALTKHITEAWETSEGKNSLWKYFGVSFVGVPTEQGGTKDQLALILSQIEGMRGQIADATVREDLIDTSEDMGSQGWRIRQLVRSVFGDAFLGIKIDRSIKKVSIHLNKHPSTEELNKLTRAMKRKGFVGWDIVFFR